ncbi:MAG: zinc ribbon domain-containing protein [Candidatus Margulisiibacteriota bacterium]
MPYYDYKCTKCETIFEIKKGMNDSSEPICPQCSAKTQRIFNAPRTCRCEKDAFNSVEQEQSGSCGTCSSGTCGSCKH